MSTLAEALAPKSDQLNADDLIAGPRTLKFTNARILKDGRETKIVVGYEGDNGKPWKPCKTMGRAMVMAWAITEPEQLVGKSVRVYRDPDVTFGAEGKVGGIRISHMSNIDKAVHIKLTVSQGKKGMFTFQPLPSAVAQSSDFTIDQARADLQSAETLEDLKAVWQRKAMAPFRADLQTDLDARKAALFEQGPSDDQRGDAHDGTLADDPRRAAADKMIHQVMFAKNETGLAAMERSFDTDLSAMPEELQIEVETAVKQKRASFA